MYYSLVLLYRQWCFIFLQGLSALITSNPNISGSNNIFKHSEKVHEVVGKWSELYKHQTTVEDLLVDEGENATIETRALSVIINKTIYQTCSWVRLHCFCYCEDHHIFIWFLCSCKQCWIQMIGSTALLLLNSREQWLNCSSLAQSSLWETHSVSSQVIPQWTAGMMRLHSRRQQSYHHWVPSTVRNWPTLYNI